jgi:hypothetical protein
MYCKCCQNVNCVSVLEGKLKGLASPVITVCDEEQRIVPLNTQPVIVDRRFVYRMHCIGKSSKHYVRAVGCELYPYFEEGCSLQDVP